jgi:hypothetical protein
LPLSEIVRSGARIVAFRGQDAGNWRSDLVVIPSESRMPAAMDELLFSGTTACLPESDCRALNKQAS